MNVVLYTHDLEPITIIDLPFDLYRRLWDRETIAVLPVPPQISFSLSEEQAAEVQLRVVRLTADILRKGDNTTLLVFTVDEVDALRLKAAFLPGQHGEVQRREREAFINGLLAL